jgi:quercetin dioxygenase-like cupin family protein
MKRFSSITVVLASVFFATAAAAAGPMSVKVEMQNDKLTVLRIRIAPHERTPMHDVTPRVVVWLTPAQLKDTAEDGTSKMLRRRPGESEWVPAQRHSGENLGNGPIEFLAIVPR